MVITPDSLKGRPPTPLPPVLKSFPSFCPQLLLPSFIQLSTWKGTRGQEAAQCQVAKAKDEESCPY